jgi:hypothetical protein
MIKTGMLSFFTRNRAAQRFLVVLFFWSLVPLQGTDESAGLNRVEQREYFVQGQAAPSPAVPDFRGKHSADHQLNVFARTPQDEFEAFERTMTADRATVIRTFLPFPAHVVHTQQMSSDL